MRVILIFGGEDMARYQTEQKRIILAYMKAHSEEAFTIEELCRRLKEEP